MIRPIPKKLLIHSVAHKYGRTINAYQKETFAETRTITYVRMEPTTAIVKSKENQEIKLTSMLLYDCVNSSPSGVVFALDEVIVWNGRDYRIKLIDPLHDTKMHHYELGLV